MSSKVLYPPILDSYLPAFQASEGKCKVFFSLSNFNSSTDFKCVHIAVLKQGNGLNVVKPVDEEVIDIFGTYTRYRKTGIIMNVPFKPVENKDNLYYCEILSSDIGVKDNDYNGFIPGWIYKIQIRLSASEYDESEGQAAWLNNHSSDFSEWSTVCTTKAIGEIILTIPPIGYTSKAEDGSNSAMDEINTLYLSTLDFFGNIKVENDPSEVLYQYNVKLYDATNNLLEDSGDIYASQYLNNNEFKYLIHKELEDTKEYSLIFTYITNNGYQDYLKYDFDVSLTEVATTTCEVRTLENDDAVNPTMKNFTSLEEEENEGRVALKLYSTNMDHYNGNICVRRTSSKSNYKIWEDIKIFIVNQTVINDLPAFYDITIESGVFYQYGVQFIDEYGNRSGLRPAKNYVIRNFEYSYLLGENNQQLKLMFNNTMPSYKIQLMESKLETIGGRYPIVTRNAALKYRIFPINGLISFFMDENHLFCNKTVIYGNSNIAEQYNKYANKEPEEPYSTEHHHDHPATQYLTYSWIHGEDIYYTTKGRPSLNNIVYTNVRCTSESGFVVHGYNLMQDELTIIKDNGEGQEPTIYVCQRLGDIGKPNEIIGDSPSYEEYIVEANKKPANDDEDYQPQYDYIYERDFRQKVLDFLHDGKPKLFKSPTEGNIIVRLTDINCTPNQTTDRLIYEFASTGNELAEATYENYLKYNFLNPGPWSSEFYTTETKLGQVKVLITPDDENSDIINEIYKKYDTTGWEYAGYRNIVMNIHHLRITINDKPITVLNYAKERVIGNNLIYNGSTLITMYAPQQTYEFDERLTFDRNSHILLGGEYYTNAEKENILQFNPNYNFKTPISITADFLYELKTEVYIPKRKQTRQVFSVIGQIFSEYMPDVNIRRDIYFKYYVDWPLQYRKLLKISSIEIEANPGTIFMIRDEKDPSRNGEMHEIGDTGVLRFYDLADILSIVYYGKRDFSNGDIIRDQPADVLINYICVLEQGTYRGE